MVISPMKKKKTLCFYHVTNAFQSESALYSCLNVKEFLAQNWRNICSLSNSNGIRTHNHLVRLTKWLSVRLQTKWLWVQVKKKRKLKKKIAIHKHQKGSKRETSNLLDETIYSIVVFKIDVFFVLPKEELPNNSTSENLESFTFKILSSMFRMLSMRINLSSEKSGQ